MELSEYFSRVLVINEKLIANGKVMAVCDCDREGLRKLVSDAIFAGQLMKSHKDGSLVHLGSLLLMDAAIQKDGDVVPTAVRIKSKLEQRMAGHRNALCKPFDRPMMVHQWAEQKALYAQGLSRASGFTADMAMLGIYQMTVWLCEHGQEMLEAEVSQ